MTAQVFLSRPDEFTASDAYLYANIVTLDDGRLVESYIINQVTGAYNAYVRFRNADGSLDTQAPIYMGSVFTSDGITPLAIPGGYVVATLNYNGTTDVSRYDLSGNLVHSVNVDIATYTLPTLSYDDASGNVLISNFVTLDQTLYVHTLSSSGQLSSVSDPLTDDPETDFDEASFDDTTVGEARIINGEIWVPLTLSYEDGTKHITILVKPNNSDRDMVIVSGMGSDGDIDTEMATLVPLANGSNLVVFSGDGGGLQFRHYNANMKFNFKQHVTFDDSVGHQVFFNADGTYTVVNVGDHGVQQIELDARGRYVSHTDHQTNIQRGDAIPHAPAFRYGDDGFGVVTDYDMDWAHQLLTIIGAVTPYDDTLTLEQAQQLDALGGDDKITGTHGNDTLIGNTGQDTLFGEDGDDRLFLDAKPGTAWTDDGGGTERAFGGSGNDVIVGLQGTHDIYGNTGDDTIIGGTDTDIANGGSGNDVLRLRSGDDQGKGGSGNDSLDGGGGDDRLWGGAQKDTLIGGKGNDTLSGDKGNDTLFGNQGDDSLIGGGGNDVIKGETGNDVIQGGLGKDILLGGDGDDDITGGDGKDVIKGGKGSDALSGGAGADIFIFDGDGAKEIGQAEGDIIMDFQSGLDKIRIVGATGVSSFADLTITPVDEIGNFAIAYQQRFIQVFLSSVVESDFEFV